MTSSRTADLGWTAEAIGLVAGAICAVVALYNFVSGTASAGFVNLIVTYAILIVASLLASHKWQALAASLSGSMMMILAQGYYRSTEDTWPLIFVPALSLWCFFTLWFGVLYGHSLGIFFTDFHSSEQSN